MIAAVAIVATLAALAIIGGLALWLYVKQEKRTAEEQEKEL